MGKNSYFKPTPTYIELMILDFIEKNSFITQREMSKQLSVSVSTINEYIDLFVKRDFIHKINLSAKKIQYTLTKKGIGRKKLLNLGFLSASQKIYDEAKYAIYDFFHYISHMGYSNILLYGAGDVAEILISTIENDKSPPIKIVALIDDDELKHNKSIMGIKILGIDKISTIDFDGILISSFSHMESIRTKLEQNILTKTKIIEYFTKEED